MTTRRAGVMAGEVLRHLLQKPATINYPAQPVQMPDRYRGRIKFVAEKCVGCKLCVKDCPAFALVINKVGDKRFEAVFELDHCIYCAQCVDSCRKEALIASPEFELAAGNRTVLRTVFDAPPAPPAPAAAEPAKEDAAKSASAPATESAPASDSVKESVAKAS